MPNVTLPAKSEPDLIPLPLAVLERPSALLVHSCTPQNSSTTTSEQRIAAYQVQQVPGNDVPRARLVLQSASRSQELPPKTRCAAERGAHVFVPLALHCIPCAEPLSDFIASLRVRLPPTGSSSAMISDTTLTTLSNGLGIAAMGLIVLYHFVAVNGKRMEQ